MATKEASMAIELLDLSREELEKDLGDSFGFPSFRAGQLMQWIHRYRHTSFQEMTNFSKQHREGFANRYQVFRPTPTTIQQSRDGTRKFLFELADGEKVETVLIKQLKRNTLCVSSQVGCAIGCKFCRTALMGFKRHLRTSEIIGQVLAVKDDVAKRNDGEDFTNIVFMGMGEPLHNFDNVVRAIAILNDNLGLNFSGRKITVSTSGLVPGIEKLGLSNANANLAVSLNATTNQVRDRLIPINKKWPLEALLKALHSFPLLKRQRITIEYVLLHGVNDTLEDLNRLPGLLRGLPSKVNLIPYNQNTGLGFITSPREVIERWQNTLLDKGLNATIRWSKGEDIAAACGQLAVDVVPTH